ncbi:hypothetical protein HG531_013922 [Fusarium graminearum]|nr:hypothetical protein HG531_013922 [Fusarium graminearum]
MIESCSDERNRKYTTSWEGNVKEGIHPDCTLTVTKDSLVLWSDGSDKEVDSRHLHDSEETNEYEPRRPNLLDDSAVMEDAPYSRGNMLSLLSFNLIIALGRSQKILDVVDHGFAALSFLTTLVAKQGRVLVNFLLRARR